MVLAYRKQKYKSIRKTLQKKGNLFVDCEFPAIGKSLFYSKEETLGIEWKRPREICESPLFVNPSCRGGDLCVGQLGNPWFVTACHRLAEDREAWEKVVPDAREQEWNQTNTYCGIFHFQFLRFGIWVDVVVDDLLPTKDDKLIFCRSKNGDEFWSALLEKAYAKLHGDYESLFDVLLSDALLELTGCITSTIYPPDTVNIARNYFRIQAINKHRQEMNDSFRSNAAIICSYKDESGYLGLTSGHCYVVTSVIDITGDVTEGDVTDGDGVPGKPPQTLIRMWDPCEQTKWTGAWAEQSEEWESLPEEVLAQLNMEEGEFWMAFEDVLKNFTKIDICHFVKHDNFAINGKRLTLFPDYGKWRIGERYSESDRAGGCAQFDSVMYNPQYIFKITSDNSSILIGLEQYNTTEMDADYLCIGFLVMKVAINCKHRLSRLDETVYESQYIASRSVSTHEPLNRGRYVIIPTTKKPKAAGDYLLRVYGVRDIDCRPLTKEYQLKLFCGGYNYFVISTVKVICCAELSSSQYDEINSFVQIKNERSKVQSDVIMNNCNPTWNCKAIFYRKDYEKPIIIEIWNRPFCGKDEFLGQAAIEFSEEDYNGEMNTRGGTVNLQGQQGSSRVVSGTVKYEIVSG